MNAFLRPLRYKNGSFTNAVSLVLIFILHFSLSKFCPTHKNACPWCRKAFGIRIGLLHDPFLRGAYPKTPVPPAADRAFSFARLCKQACNAPNKKPFGFTKGLRDPDWIIA